MAANPYQYNTHINEFMDSLLLPNPEARSRLFGQIARLQNCSVVDAIHSYNHLSVDELTSLLATIENGDEHDRSALNRQRYLLLLDIHDITHRSYAEIQNDYGTATIAELQAIKADAEIARYEAERREVRVLRPIIKLPLRSEPFTEPKTLLQPGKRKMTFDE